MASQSILRASVKSPARALMRPTAPKSILKRPAPLPLSPSPFTASFSVVVSGSKLSPHVHFPASPSMVASFTAHSANTYDRGPIITSPASADHSSWMGRMLSPTAHNAFKLSDPPKRTPGVPKKERISLAPPPAMVSDRYLSAPPPYVDPRSPKPYCSRAGVTFDELTLHVPRGNVGVEDLGRALTTYPRSPYPSAPIEAKEADLNEDMVTRGRSAERVETQSASDRTRSLESKSRRRQNAQSFLSPVKESTISSQPVSRKMENKMQSPETRLNQEFWAAVTLEDSPAIRHSVNSPHLMFGNQDGSLWSPRPNKREPRSFIDYPMLSPAQRNTFRKGMVASPSPNDPLAAFPSFTVALMNMDGAITYPPRARVE